MHGHCEPTGLLLASGKCLHSSSSGSGAATMRGSLQKQNCVWSGMRQHDGQQNHTAPALLHVTPWHGASCSILVLLKMQPG